MTCALCGTSQRLFVYVWHITGRRLPCTPGHDHEIHARPVPQELIHV